MRESTFIDRNKTKWEDLKDFEKENPDEAASDFVEIISDLSYAKTHYPHSKITSYLNHLAVSTYRSVFKKRKSRPILDFWKVDFPLILGKNKRVLWVSVVLFLTFCILGAVCSSIEPEFIESVMGSNYIEMTHENIEKGEPFGVYNQEEPYKMFLRILANNLFVGLIVFISGIFLGLGSVYHTFKNGIMVGSFFSIFFKYKLGLTSVLIVGLHGTLELMALILECMAGLILGLSFLFPGTLTRKQAFRKGLTQSAQIYIGAIPFTLIAAFIESYITRLGTGGFLNAPVYAKIFLFFVFFLSWAILIWYFFIYSKQVARSVSSTAYRNQYIQ
jgi:uncharacterized membrane protein SpoIIM required for sporulation